jgi:hypothetical protein
MVAAAVVGVGVLGAYTANKAGKSQADAANKASDLNQQQYWQTREDQTPWRDAGGRAVNQLSEMSGPGGYFTHTFDANDLNANMAPNWQFRLQQGQTANQNAAGVGGGLVGGNALKGLQDYTQNAAGDAYQQAFSNYTANQTNIYNRLSNLAGLGQTANQATSTAGMNAANNSGNFLTSGAAAQAAGNVGMANAASNGLSNYLGWNYLNGGGSSGGSSWAQPQSSATQNSLYGNEGYGG